MNSKFTIFILSCILSIHSFAQNVGIGTAMPASKLHIMGQTRIETNAEALHLVGTNHVYQGFYPNGFGAGRKAWLGFGGSGNTTLNISNEFPNGHLTLWTVGNGNVGVSTSSPQTKFHVNGAETIGGDVTIASGSFAGLPFVYGGTHRALWFGSYDGITPVGSDYGLIYAEYTNAGGLDKYTLNICSGDNANNQAINDDRVFVGNINFSTISQGGITVENQRVYIGAGKQTPSYTLDINGNTRCTSGTWTASDKRFKKNVETIPNALGIINQLRGTSYDYRTEEFSQFNFPTETTLGFIAQEVKTALPNCVSEDKDGYHSVNYQAIIPVLVEAIKEQQKQIESLQSQVLQLKMVRL